MVAIYGGGCWKIFNTRRHCPKAINPFVGDNTLFCRGVGNRLRELGQPTGLNQQWAGDLTYLKVRGKWRYLAVVLDLFSRKVIAWSLGEKRPHELPARALQYALSKRRPKPGLVFRSDGGIEYRSFAYQGLLTDCGIISSMNRPGKCTDNAIVESFSYIQGRVLPRQYLFYNRGTTAWDFRLY